MRFVQANPSPLRRASLALPLSWGLEAEAERVEAGVKLVFKDSVHEAVARDLRLAREGVRHDGDGKVCVVERGCAWCWWVAVECAPCSMREVGSQSHDGPGMT